MTRRAPAPVCCHCHAPLNEFGGARIIQGPGYGVVLRDIRSKLDWIRDADVRLRRLDGDLRDLCVAVWGHLDDRTIDTAAAQVRAGQRPWFCQRCASLLHADCGHSLWYTPATEVLHDDGKVVHRPIVPAATIPCVVADCPNGRRPTGDGSASSGRESRVHILKNG